MSQGLVARRAHELAEQALASARGEVEMARAAVSGAEADVVSLRAEALPVAASADADIEKAPASLQSAHASQSRLQVEHIKLQTRRLRQAAMAVTAPRDGTVLRIISWAGSGVAMTGDPLATFVPNADIEAVELWVDGPPFSTLQLLRPGQADGRLSCIFSDGHPCMITGALLLFPPTWPSIVMMAW